MKSVYDLKTDVIVNIVELKTKWSKILTRNQISTIGKTLILSVIKLLHVNHNRYPEDLECFYICPGILVIVINVLFGYVLSFNE